MRTRFAARELVDLHIDLVPKSFDHSAPFMSLVCERHTRLNWASSRGAVGGEAYWAERNCAPLDGMPRDIACLSGKPNPK